eukprot:718692-Pyramimonas_sp.AAC.1
MPEPSWDVFGGHSPLHLRLEVWKGPSAVHPEDDASPDKNKDVASRPPLPPALPLLLVFSLALLSPSQLLFSFASFSLLLHSPYLNSLLFSSSSWWNGGWGVPPTPTPRPAPPPSPLVATSSTNGATSRRCTPTP